MARGKGLSEGTGKIKFRMVEFEMDGTDASLEDGIKAIAAALNRAGGQTKLIAKQNGAGEQTIQPPDFVESIAGEEQGPQEEKREESTRAARAPAKPKKVVARKVVTDFLLDDVTPTLKQFVESKGSPSTDLSKYLMVAAWAKEHKKMGELSPDHFYTAYKYMGWDVPKDPAQPIRDLMHHRRGKFSKPTNPGWGQINHVGINDVDKMGKA